MTPALPGGRLGRASALGVTCLLFGFLWFGLARPFSTWYAERARLIAQHEALARELAVQGARVPALVAEANALRTGAVAGRVLVAGASDAIASAALEDALERLASAAGASASDVETLAARTAGSYRRVGIRVTLAATWPVLIRLLGAIELAMPRMLVGDVEVRASPFRSENTEQPLDVLLTIFAFRMDQTSARVARQSQASGARPQGRDRVREWIEGALARPLFNPSRRAVASGAASGGPALPRLAGIVVSPSGREAIFSPPAGGKPVVLHVGGTVGGWSVTKISPVEVTLERGRLVQVLRPAFDAAAGSSRPGGATGEGGRPFPYSASAGIPAITRLLERSPQ